MAGSIRRLLEYTDAQTGPHRLLEESGLKNTLVLYAADNGSSGEGSPDGSVTRTSSSTASLILAENMKMIDKRWRPRLHTTIIPPAGRWLFQRRSRCSNVTRNILAAPAIP